MELDEKFVIYSFCIEPIDESTLTLNLYRTESSFTKFLIKLDRRQGKESDGVEAFEKMKSRLGECLSKAQNEKKMLHLRYSELRAYLYLDDIGLSESQFTAYLVESIYEQGQ